MSGLAASKRPPNGKDTEGGFRADGTQPTTRKAEWCAYCGERFESGSEAITVTFEGENVHIHRKEYSVYMERGLLKYRDGPRTGWLSEFAVEILILCIGVAVVVFWLSLQLIWRW